MTVPVIILAAKIGSNIEARYIIMVESLVYQRDVGAGEEGLIDGQVALAMFVVWIDVLGDVLQADGRVAARGRRGYIGDIDADMAVLERGDVVVGDEDVKVGCIGGVCRGSV